MSGVSHVGRRQPQVTVQLLNAYVQWWDDVRGGIVRGISEYVVRGAFMADGFQLGTDDAAGHWTWTGARLYGEDGFAATHLRHEYADLTAGQRRDRVAQLQLAWLAAQWNQPEFGCRLELRFANDPETRRVHAAILLRVVAATRQEAADLAEQRMQRATDPDLLPPHVLARPIESEAELRGWLGRPRLVGEFIEVRKHLSARPITRCGARRTYAIRHGFFDSGDAWETWWREFAQLDFPAVLCLGFDAYDAGNSVFRQELNRRALEMEDLASQGISSPLHPYPMPPDPAALLAVGDYRRAVARYVGRCFRLRVSLVSENEVPPRSIAALVGTVSCIPGAVGPVRVIGPEFAEAMREHRALGAPRLAETYRQGLPIAPDPMDELLDSLVDLPEAAAVLSLPAHWSGTPAYFDDAPTSAVSSS